MPKMQTLKEMMLPLKAVMMDHYLSIQKILVIATMLTPQVSREMTTLIDANRDDYHDCVKLIFPC